MARPHDEPVPREGAPSTHTTPQIGSPSILHRHRRRWMGVDVMAVLVLTTSTRAFEPCVPHAVTHVRTHAHTHVHVHVHTHVHTHACTHVCMHVRALILALLLEYDPSTKPTADFGHKNFFLLICPPKHLRISPKYPQLDPAASPPSSRRSKRVPARQQPCPKHAVGDADTEPI